MYIKLCKEIYTGIEKVSRDWVGHLMILLDR
jgi:hypothetical protein